jgi:ribosomal protein S27AE
MPKGKKTTAAKRRRKAKATPAPKKDPRLCMVKGCQGLALAKHHAPDGSDVWLCGKCDSTAKRNLDNEAKRQQMVDVIGSPLERTAALRAKQAERRAAA